MSEFTGERVIPGEVEVDLWNEHFARYTFASRFAPGRRVLDIGCGTGYGTAEISRAASTTVGLDVSIEAVRYAAGHFENPNLEFITASATAVPHAGGTFDLITAFEVIEHLEDWSSLIREAHRLLRSGGQFIVSTPNKAYYAESRGERGANPFHVHEFEAEEFRDELGRVFPYVTLLVQNRSEAFVFSSPQSDRDTDARIDDITPDETAAHFFIGICSNESILEPASFVYVPRAANVLKEREHHIAVLKDELRSMTDQRGQVLVELAKQKEHLEQQNNWALGLEREWKAAQQRIVQLQSEFSDTVDQYEKKVEGLEEETRQRAEWAIETDRRLTREIDELKQRLTETVELLDRAETCVEERTRWALDLQSKLEEASTQLSGAKASRWVKVGRMFGVGPEL